MNFYFSVFYLSTINDIICDILHKIYANKNSIEYERLTISKFLNIIFLLNVNRKNNRMVSQVIFKTTTAIMPVNSNYMPTITVTVITPLKTTIRPTPLSTYTHLTTDRIVSEKEFSESTHEPEDETEPASLILNQVMLYKFGVRDQSREANLSHLKIDHIDSQTFDGAKTLEKLVLKSNNLALIENSFNSLKNLKLLDLSANLILGIYINDFSGLSELLELNLNSNSLETIESDSFSSLKKLKVLRMNTNYLKSLDADVFNGLDQLQNLDISKNEIDLLKAFTFRSINKLTLLNLAENNIETIEPTAFRGLDSLQELYLNGNQLENIDAVSFQGLAKLKTLRLNANFLRELEQDLFLNLNSLTRLNLNSNKLTSISQYTFSRLKGLRRLDLSKNQISHIHKNALLGTCNIESLLLDSNPVQSSFIYVKEDCVYS